MPTGMTAEQLGWDTTTALALRSLASAMVVASPAAEDKVAIRTAHDVNFAVNLQLWANISDILWWTVIIISALSIGILCQTQMLMRRYRKSNYFHILVFMLILHIIMLISIIFNLTSERYFAFKGNMTCRLTAFITNVTSCYINWLWVMMFVQRFIHVFYPMHRIKANDGGTMFRIIDDTRQVILLTGIMAATAQLWTPFLMKEVLVYDDNSDEIKGSYCGPDPIKINPNLYKWITVVESLWTYGIPCLITVFADVAVLVFRHDSKRFTTVCVEEIMSGKKISGANGRRVDERANTAAVISAYNEAQSAANGSAYRTSKSNPRQIYATSATVAPEPVGTDSEISRLLTAATALAAGTPPPKPPRQPQAQDHGLSMTGEQDHLLSGSQHNHFVVGPNSDSRSRSQQGHLLPEASQPQGAPQRGRTWPHGAPPPAAASRHVPVSTNGLIGALNATRPLRAKSITVPIKIQSEDAMRACNRRRQRAIRRCLLMATMQLLLNLPNYVLQLVDEFTGWRRTDRRFAEFYLYADALFYLLYLSQYPMMAVYVRWLHGNFDSKPTGTANGTVSSAAACNLSTASSTYGAGTANGCFRSSSRSNVYRVAAHGAATPVRPVIETAIEARRRRLSVQHANDDIVPLVIEGDSRRVDDAGNGPGIQIASPCGLTLSGLAADAARPRSAAGRAVPPAGDLPKRHSIGGTLF